MSAVYEHHHTVLDSEIDMQQHANNVCYLHWFQDAAVAHSADRGWPSSRYQKEGIAWVARSHFLEYLAPAFAGDELVIRTWISDFRRVTSQRRYELRRTPDDTVLASGETKWAFVTIATGAPRRIPEEVLQAFEVLADSE